MPLAAVRPAVWALGAVCLLSAATLVVLGSRLTFFNDEWYVLLQRPGFGAGTLLEPHNGHLSVVPVLVYKGLLAGFGLEDQLPFRIVLVAVICSLAVLVFAYVRERAGQVLGLLAAATLLFLGSAWQDLLWSFQIGLVGSLAAGIGALLALERGTRRGDIAASALLVLSIACSNLGVSFIVAAAIALLLRSGRRGLWVAVLPALLFAAWWLAYGQGSATGFSLDNVPTTPAYVVNAIAAAFGSLAGLTNIDGGAEVYRYGRILLVLALAGTLLWLWRGGRPSRGALPIAAAALSFWALLGLDFIPEWREPNTSRYQLISVTFLILFFAEFFRPVRLPRAALATTAVLALAGIAANLGALADGYRFFRDQSAISRADLGALDIGRGRIPMRFHLRTSLASSPYLSGVRAGDYYRARDSHGSPAYSPAQIAAAGEAPRRAADVVLGSAYGLVLERVSRPPALGGDRCEILEPASAAGVGAGEIWLSNLGRAPAQIRMRRFASGFPLNLDRLGARATARVRIPPDSVKRRWSIAARGDSPVRICRS